MTVQPTRDQLRALADAATPGPWAFDDLDGGTYLKPPATGAMLVGYGAGVDQQRRDAEFIAAARTAVPQLLDQLDQAEARADYWRTEARTQRHRADDQEDRAIRAQGNLDAAQARAATAEARIQAVRDVLAQHPYGGPDQEDAIRRALKG